MATIRCTDVADSAQFVAELRYRGGRTGGRSFVGSLLRCSSCCGRPGHPFGRSSGEGSGALNSECSSYYKTINALLQLHPGMTRSFCHGAAQKGVVCYKRRKSLRVWLLCWVNRECRWSTEFEVRQLMFSFIAWIRGSLLQSACGRCQ